MIVLNTNHGAITLELNFDKAPISAANFLDYAKSGFYDGTIFHRVIDNFMIQGGGFEPGLNQKPNGEPIKNEADNGLPNVVGSIAMARTSDPHSATSGASSTKSLTRKGKRRGKPGASVLQIRRWPWPAPDRDRRSGRRHPRYRSRPAPPRAPHPRPFAVRPSAAGAWSRPNG